jgi:hypothetical protein
VTDCGHWSMDSLRGRTCRAWPHDVSMVL